MQAIQVKRKGKVKTDISWRIGLEGVRVGRSEGLKRRNSLGQILIQHIDSQSGFVWFIENE